MNIRFISLAHTPALRLLMAPVTASYKRYVTSDSTPSASVRANLPRSDSGTQLKSIYVDREEGISDGLGGFGHYAGSITAFMKPKDEKNPATCNNMPLPCDTDNSQVGLQPIQEKLAEAVTMGKLPSPRNTHANFSKLPPQGQANNAFTAPSPSSLPRRAAQQVKRSATQEMSSSSSNDTVASRVPPAFVVSSSKDSNSIPDSAGATSTGNTTASQKESAKEVEDYYRSIPSNEVTKEDMWQRIKQTSTMDSREVPTVLSAQEIDFVRMEENIKEMDSLHHSLGELAYPDEGTRRGYYVMWYLAMSLNKARWSMLEVQAQQGIKSTGAGMKLLFWKDAVNSIMKNRAIVSGQFTDSHPVLRPFGTVVSNTPSMTKTFVRGFTDARLRVIQQPGNVKQLFDHFDKFYGYFFNSLLEVTQVKDENAEHMMQHIGRAIGLTTHSVMLWKKYVRLGVTMLPADLCADNHVNLALLKNIPLASRDGGVQKLLYDVMCIVKTEMLNAQKLAPLVSPKAWPIVMECLYPNYYLGFLQRRMFNVSAMFADYNIENPGLVWYRMKKRWEWEKHQSIERLLDEAAPLPWIKTSLSHRGSKYKMSTTSDKDKK